MTLSDMLYLWVGAHIVFLMMVLFIFDGNFSFYNPKVIHDNIPVNWFGAIVLAAIANVCFPAWAVIYWIYKLFTVGA